MKNFFFSITLCSVFSFISKAQNDSVKYYNKDWKVTSKDSAYYYSTFSYSDGLYKTKDYYSATNKLQMDGGFLEKNMTARHGIFRWYYESGPMSDSVVYNNGKRMEGWYFYENGTKKARLAIVNGGAITQGWDENGNEIPNYVFEKAAEFPGGSAAWRKYLERNLDRSAAQRAGAPVGQYTVKVGFIVGKKGKISNVHAISFPSNCARCAEEAIRVIQKGPDWNPAIQFGEPVIFQAVQFVTFQVATN